MTPEPYSLTPLWDAAFIADDADEAMVQAEKQIAPYEGKVVLVDRLTVQHPDHSDWLEIGHGAVIPVRVVRLAVDDIEWDDDVLYPEWFVAPTDPEQTVTFPVRGGEVAVRLADCTYVWTTAPGVGTREGFGADGPFVEVTDEWWPSNVPARGGAA